MKVLVKSDVFNICNRIKKFDTSYYIAFNNISNKYEVYSTRLTQSVEVISGVVLSYVCTLPYTELDARTIKYLYDTSIDNLDDIISHIDKSNQELEYKNHLRLKQQSLQIAENKLRQLT
ncbi:MAG: hypothetical protein IJ371_05955 [Clostridia bacterium]|nr:hypothetical protein [Clostridia bacterium]